MDPLSSDYLAELGRQFAAIAAFLGGFSITFFGTLLAIKNDSRCKDWALGTAAFAAGAFTVTVVAVTMLITSLHPNAPTYLKNSEALTRGRIVTAGALILGTVSLLSSLALSGWLHSRAIGIITSAIGFFSTILVLWAFAGFFG